jgi:hypothetical protein
VKVLLYSIQIRGLYGGFTTVGWCNKPNKTIGFYKPFLIENSDNMRVINALIVHEVGHLAYGEHNDLHDAFCITRGYNPNPIVERLIG